MDEEDIFIDFSIAQNKVLEEPIDYQRDLPRYCVMEDEDFEESIEED